MWLSEMERKYAALDTDGTQLLTNVTVGKANQNDYKTTIKDFQSPMIWWHTSAPYMQDNNLSSAQHVFGESGFAQIDYSYL